MESAKRSSPQPQCSAQTDPTVMFPKEDWYTPWHPPTVSFSARREEHSQTPPNVQRMESLRESRHPPFGNTAATSH